VRIFVHAEFLSTKILNLSANYLNNSLCVGLRGVTWRFDVLEVKRVNFMGKWSLPNRLSSVCHVLSISSIGLLKVRSTFVSVLCVLK